MNLTIENYSEIFGDLEERVKRIPVTANPEMGKSINQFLKTIKDIHSKAEDVLQKNQLLRIGVVGQVKAGKSSFLNSLIFDGESILPKASTPMTAGLTILEYKETNEFEVEYFNEGEWDHFVRQAEEYDNYIESYKKQHPNELIPANEAIEKELNIPIEIKSAKEMVVRCKPEIIKANIKKKSETKTSKFETIADLQSILEDYVGAEGSHTSIVKCLTIRLKDERLKDLQIVDTPGVNDPIVSREQRTREFLRSCHGVFFLSSAARFFDSTDVSFLTDRIGSEGIGTVVLIASKFDSALQDAAYDQDNCLESAWTYCEDAMDKQFKTNIEKTSFSGNRPKLSFNSGICYSIYKKPFDQLDSMESHVLARMKKCYPDDIGCIEDPQELKELFLELSNIDDIRTTYFEETFKRNRDDVKKSKVNGYLTSISKELKDSYDFSLSSLRADCSVMMNNNLDQIKKQKDYLKTLMASVRERFEKSTSEVSSEAINLRIPMILEKLTFPDFEKTKKSAEVKGEYTKFIFFTGSERFRREVYDIHEYIDLFNKNLDIFDFEVRELWKELVTGGKSYICKIMEDVFYDIEKQNSDFIIDMYISKLKQIKLDHNNEVTPLPTDFIDTRKSHVIDQFQQIKPISLSEQVNKEQAEKLVNKEVERYNKEVEEANIILTDLLKQDLKACLESLYNDKVTPKFADMREDLLRLFEGDMQKKIENLEEMADKKDINVFPYEIAIKELESLSI